VISSSTFIVAFVLADGLVRGNSLAWAAPWRAGLLAVLIVSGLLVFVIKGHFHDQVTMGIVGVIGAMLVSDSYYHIGGLGIPAMVLYAGAFAWQRIVQHDWRPGFARAGIILSALVLLVGVTGHAPPNMAWNRNVIAGTIVALLPAAWSLWESDPARRWGAVALSLAAVGITVSRGAWMGAAAAMFVLLTEQVRLSQLALIALGISAPAALLGLVALKPVQSIERLYFMRSAVEQWWQASPLFGVGPGQLLVTAPGKSLPDYHAHNAVVSFVSQVGLAGGGILGVALGGVARRVIGHGWQRWQLATLAAVAVHSLVDEPMTWWPTGLIVALVLAGSPAVQLRAEQAAPP
jgi:hypothetical protein